MENKLGKKDERISIFISFVVMFEIDAVGNYHSQKVYPRLLV